MLVGYNNNVTYKGKVYHAQTEDSGLKNPIIVTLLYYKGTILASKKTNYSHLIGSKDIKESVRELMKGAAQGNTERIDSREIYRPGSGRGPEPGAGESSAEVQNAVSAGLPEQGSKGDADKTLDDILLDYIIKREKSK